MRSIAMSLGLLLTAAVSVLLLILVNGSILWLCCKMTRVPGGSYRRSLLAVLSAILLMIAALSLEWKVLHLAQWPIWAVLAAHLFLAWIFLIMAIGVVVRPSFRKSVLVGTLGIIFPVILAIPVMIGLSFFFQRLIVPTGAMATTILGYHKTVICPECGHTCPVNASIEGEPLLLRGRVLVTGCTCPNCRYDIQWQVEEPRSGNLNVVDMPALVEGDRFLVSKSGDSQLKRQDLVVF